MILLPACVAVEITHGEHAGRSLHCGGLPTAACAGGSRQSNAARAQGVAPLPPRLAPESPLGWPRKMVCEAVEGIVKQSHDNTNVHLDLFQEKSKLKNIIQKMTMV